MVDVMHSGRCLCGDVTYVVEGSPIVVAHCHCEECQRVSGAGHSTGAMYPVEKFRLTGKISKFEYTSNNDNTVTKVFCPKCGSPIFGRNSGMQDVVTVSLGTIDNSSQYEPQVTIFARNCRSWDAIDKSTEVFETQPDWKPEDGVS